jgi:hypothetical protein
MSYTRSNLYASRIYAEHPVALWSMDEPNYFVSLISDAEKEVTESNWDFDNATINASATFTLSGYPFDDLDVNKIYLSTDSPKEMEVSLSSAISYSELDLGKGSICVSSYIYIPGETDVLYLDIGFIVDGEYVYKRYLSLKVNNWEKISHTVKFSEDTFTPFIRVGFYPSVDALEEESSVYINGVSVGQWSEPYNSVSTGISPQPLPSNIRSLIDFPESIECTVLDPYGLSTESENGYVTSISNSLFAKLAGVPMVYGSSGNIRINKDAIVLTEILDGSSLEEILIDGGSSSTEYMYSIDGGASYEFLYLTEDQYYNFPSLIFPGKGFLNQSGKNKTLTTEFWLRINPEKTKKNRIFGPLTSSDGIYIDKEFISIVVGNYTKSYFIGKWYRPMLMHFCQSPSEIFLMINGEKVISIPIESLDIATFPIKDEDFLGFYTDAEIYLYEIDSFSIFPYAVAEQVAKKRYVFGQGVQEQDNIVSSSNGNLSYVDFPFSGYSSTIKYPDRTKWEDGFYNNIVANSKGISLPEYSLPQVLFTNTGIGSEYQNSLASINFYEDNYELQDENYPFICMAPSYEYLFNESFGTVYFSKLNQTNYQTRSLYSVLKTSEDVTSRQSILYISNNTSSDVFEVFIDSASVQYSYNETVLKSETISQDSFFAVGIDFNKIEQAYNSVVGSFFSRPDTLSLNFAGKDEDVFLGKIFSLTINSDFFTDKDGSEMFDSYGFAIKNFNSKFYDYIGSYTLLPKATNTSMVLDIGVSGYWENSIPLSYFGRYITQNNGDLKYDLDMLQFNIDTPSSTFSKHSELSSLYQESLSTKVFVTLQDVSKIGKTTYTQFTNTEIIGIDKILDLGKITSPNNTKYKINDKTVMYVPKNIAGFSNYYVTIHIEISSKGIKTENVNVKNMGIAGLSFDEGQFYSINTPTAGKFYPIVKNENQYVYKRNVPVVIDTESSPYLYLAGDSGIQVLPEVDENLIKGLSIPVNQTLKVNQEMVGIQMFLMYDEASSFTERKKIGKIFSSNNSYDIILIPEEDGKRAFFSIVDSITGDQFLDAKSFLNGKLVNDIVIEPLTWNYIAIALQENSIPLNGILAQIEIYSGVKIDNVASFMELNPIKQNLIVFDEWDLVDNRTWEYWSGSGSTSFNWQQILNEESLEVTVLSLDGKEIFNTYAGLSSGVGDDNSVISVSFDSVVILNDISWDTYLV